MLACGSAERSLVDHSTAPVFTRSTTCFLISLKVADGPGVSTQVETRDGRSLDSLVACSTTRVPISIAKRTVMPTKMTYARASAGVRVRLTGKTWSRALTRGD